MQRRVEVVKITDCAYLLVVVGPPPAGDITRYARLNHRLAASDKGRISNTSYEYSSYLVESLNPITQEILADLKSFLVKE